MFEPICVFETVTPEIAKSYLKTSIGNRKIRRDTVESYKRELRSNKFGLTNQGIGFNTDGNLYDGHHRLFAIIETSIPADLLVCRNMPKDAVDNVDRGLTRSISDIYAIHNIQHELPDSMKMLSTPRGTSALNQLVKCGFRNIKLSANEMMALYDEFKTGIDSLYGDVLSKSNLHLRSPMLSAAIAAVSNGVNPEAVARFYKVFCCDDITGCDEYNVGAALNWKRQIDDAKLRKASMDGKTLYIGTQNAIYHFSNNTHVQRIRITADYRYDVTEKIKHALRID